MIEKLIIHDLKEKKENILESISGNITVFDADSDIKNCIGCFGCWTKSPGKCLIKDRASDLTSMIAKCNEMIIISENYYGGFSSDIKCCLDRSIGYMLPFFRIVNDEMHHVMRYKKNIILKAHIYGEDITEEEKNNINNIIKANAINFGGISTNTRFYNKVGDMKGCII